MRGLPRVGDFLRPDLEAIVRLKPDLVVLDADQGRTVDALAKVGVRTLALPMHTIEDVELGLVRAGEVLGTAGRARAAAAAMRRTLDEVRGRAARRSPPRPRVLLIVDRQRGGLGNLVAAARGSFLDDLVTTAGGVNALADALVRYPRLSAEQVLVARPDVILEALPGEDGADGVWAALDVPAAAGGRIHRLSEPIYQRPGPRLGEALEGIERLLWPAGAVDGRSP